MAPSILGRLYFSHFTIPFVVIAYLFGLCIIAASAAPTATPLHLHIDQPPALVQCAPLTTTWSGGVPPYALDVVIITVSTEATYRFDAIQGTSFNTTANVPSGDEVVFVVYDSAGALAHTEPVLVQKALSSSDCPITFEVTGGEVSMAQGPYPWDEYDRTYYTNGNSTSADQGATDGPHENTVNTAAVVGATIAVLAVVVVVVVLCVLWRRRRKERRAWKLRVKGIVDAFHAAGGSATNLVVEIGAQRSNAERRVSSARSSIDLEARKKPDSALHPAQTTYAVSLPTTVATPSSTRTPKRKPVPRRSAIPDITESSSQFQDVLVIDGSAGNGMHAE